MLLSVLSGGGWVGGWEGESSDGCFIHERQQQPTSSAAPIFFELDPSAPIIDFIALTAPHFFFTLKSSPI